MKIKVYVKQAGTSWEETIESNDIKEIYENILDTIDANPYNCKYNNFTIYDEDGIIIYEGEWWHLDMVDEEEESEEWVMEQNNKTIEEIKEILKKTN